MSTIPTSLTEKQFNRYVLPFTSTPKRGFVYKIPIHKVFNYILYWLYTGCQWHQLLIEADKGHSEKEISHDVAYYHFRK